MTKIDIKYVVKYRWGTEQSKLLQELIQSKRVSLSYVAETLGRTKQYIHQYINGERTTISNKALSSILSYFDVPIEYFFKNRQ